MAATIRIPTNDPAKPITATFENGLWSGNEPHFVEVAQKIQDTLNPFWRSPDHVNPEKEAAQLVADMFGGTVVSWPKVPPRRPGVIY